MNLEQYAKMQGLKTGYSYLQFPSTSDVQADDAQVKKRLQFDTSPEVYSQVESVCSLLDCSKREFLELAVLDAIDRAQLAFENSFEEVTGCGLSEMFSKQGEINGSVLKVHDELLHTTTEE